MNNFNQKYNANTIFKLTLNKTGSFPKFQIEILIYNSCYFRSREIIISKYVLEEIIELLKNGNPHLDVSRFEFKDSEKSFLLFINGDTTIIGQTYNLLSGKREEFIVKEINKKELLDDLVRSNS